MSTLRFEEYLGQFTNTINVTEFLLNMVLAAVLASLIKIYYIRFGNSITNRKRFASNFLPLALTTMLIITIVKSSIALSLGLVGALSIVRFRAAIKDPEELTFLFLVIGIGIGTGAGQAPLAVLAIVLILILLFINRQIDGKVQFKSEDRLYINVSTDVNDLNQINQIMTSTLPYVELKRLDTLNKGLDLSFICKAESIEQITALKDKLSNLSEATTISIIDQPDLIV